MNLADILLAGADRTPDAVAVECGDQTIGYAQLRDRAVQVGRALRAAGVREGCRVALVSNNSVEFVAAVYGIVGIGAVVVVVNPRSVTDEIAYIVESSGASHVVAGDGLVDKAAEAVAARRSAEILELAAVARPAPPVEPAGADPFVSVAPDHDCFVVYTSGTTGRPKGVVRSHEACWWAAANYAPVAGFAPEDRTGFLYPIPMASVGFVNSIGGCLLHGMPVVAMSSFDRDEAVRLINSGRVTHAYLVPSMWGMLLDSDVPVDRSRTRLRWALWGGEPLPTAVADRVTAAYGDVLVGVWGCSEGSFASARPGDHARLPGTAGRATGNNRIRIVGPDLREVERGQIGGLAFAGPTTFTGYLDDPDATAEAFHGGWVLSGDLARMDADGYLWIVGRSKDMIISGGVNVYPAEIETVISAHPGVHAVAVVGAPSERWGERPVAFVVVDDDVADDDLDAWCRARLAGLKVPDRFVRAPSLPTNANGKVEKALLRGRARELTGDGHVAR